MSKVHGVIGVLLTMGLTVIPLGFVIAAMNEIEARKIAASYRRRPIRQLGDGDEAPEIWYAPTTSCTHIGVAGDDITSGVILRDYHSG